MNNNQNGINNINYTHGESNTRLYAIWVNIKQRILNPNILMVVEVLQFARNGWNSSLSGIGH